MSHQEGRDAEDNGASRYAATAYRPPGSYAAPYRPNSGYRSARDDRDSGYESRSDRDRWDTRESRTDRDREVNALLPRREPPTFTADRERREETRPSAPAPVAPERSAPVRAATEAPVQGTVQPLQKASFDRDFPTLSPKHPTFGQGSTIGSAGGGATRPADKQRWQSSSSSASASKLSQTSSTTSSERWTSRLAEAPPPGSSFLQNGNSGAAAIAAAAAAAAAAAQQSSTPKMADALQHVADTNQHSASDLARLEQLALRQSRQLVPVAPSLPGKGRDKGHPNKGPSAARETPVALAGANTGAVPSPAAAVGATSAPGPALKRTASKESSGTQGSTPAVRRPEDPTTVISAMPKRTPVLLDRHALPIAPTSSVVGTSQSLRTGMPLGTASSKISAEKAAALSQEERQRLEHVRQDRCDFFQSLRKKPANKKDGKEDEEDSAIVEVEAGEDPSFLAAGAEVEIPAAENEAQAGEPPGDDSAFDGTSDFAVDPVHAPEDLNGDTWEVDKDEASVTDVGAVISDEPDPVVSEEEARFLRSLGWDEGEEEDEDEEGGLTEEEIAAFKASLGGGSSGSKPINLTTPVVRAKVSHHIGSVGSVGSDQVSSSDSDSD